jgi:hypothetical protein
MPKIENFDHLIPEWAKSDLNGRQIRNVISSAALLARSENNTSPQLKSENINDILKDTIAFIKIIKDEKDKVEMQFLPQWSTGS